MWIELPDELIKYTENISDPMNISILSINSLFDSMLKCHHIVYGSDKVLKYFSEHELISPSNKNFINWIMQNYVYVYECYSIIKYKIIISTSIDTIEKKENVFIVPLKDLFEIRETKLLAENESDAKLFENIFKKIYIEKKMSSMYSIRLENDSFHGGNAPSKIKQLVKEKRIVVCLVDSDKDFPGGCSGPTYKSANDTFKRVKDNNIIHLKELNVREKENLISPHMYIVVSDEGTELLDILNEHIEFEYIIKYFDIKDGIKYKKIQDEKWCKHYNSILNCCIQKKIYREPTDENKDVNDFVCILGMKSNLCEKVNDILLECSEEFEKNIKKYKLNEEKIELVYEYRKNIFQKLPTYLQEEWNQIYELLFSWGCCLKSESLPIYR